MSQCPSCGYPEVRTSGVVETIAAQENRQRMEQALAQDKRIAELTATCEKQSTRIAELVEDVAAEMEVRNSAIRHHKQRAEVAEVKVSNLRERLEETEAENVKLREACETRDTIIRFHARHTYGCPAGGTMDRDCTCDCEKRMAALGEGGERER